MKRTKAGSISHNVIRRMPRYLRRLDELSESEQKVFLARYWYLASVEEIARRMDFSQSKVKSMLYRLRGRLRERLIEEGLC